MRSNIDWSTEERRSTVAAGTARQGEGRAQRWQGGSPAPDFLLHYDRQGKLIDGSLRNADQNELQSAELAVLALLVPETVAARIGRLVQAVIETRLTCETELHWQHDEQDFRIRLTLVPSLDADGCLDRVSAIARTRPGVANDPCELRRSRDILRRLAIRRLQQQEAERRAITYSLHEDLAQDLAALKMHATLLERMFEGSRPAPLGKITELAERSIARMRNMVTSLRPRVLDLGIVPALQWLAEDFRKGLEFEISLDLPAILEIGDETATFLFRAAQEAMINTALHARATRVDIRLLVTPDEICLLISDNGCDVADRNAIENSSGGLLGIAEQAGHLGGKLLVTGTAGQGTRIEIILPCAGGMKAKKQRPSSV